MRKTDKKIDNKLRQLLTEVCDSATQNFAGYKWIMHSVNYNNFPESLIITCVFENKQDAEAAQQKGDLLALIQKQLNNIPIKLKMPHKQINFKAL